MNTEDFDKSMDRLSQFFVGSIAILVLLIFLFC